MANKKHKTTVTTVDDCPVADLVKILGGIEEKLNENNRPWGEGLSKQYMAVMLQGRWNGLRVHVIREKGNKQIHNAQHVIKAAIMAEAERLTKPDYYAEKYGVDEPITLDLIIEDGILPEWADVIDTGKGRKQPDVVYKHHPFSDNYSDTNEKTLSRYHATAAKIVWARREFGEKVRTPRKFTFPDLTEVMQTNPSLITSTEYIFDLDMDTANNGESGTGWVKPLHIPAAYLVAAHYFACYSKMNEADEPLRIKKADEFFKALVYGTEATKGHPIYELREWLLKQSGGGNEYYNRLYDAVVVAWNTWIAGGTLVSKSFAVNALKKDVHYEMGGWDTAPAAPVVEEPEPEVAAEPEVPAEPAAAPAAPKRKGGIPRKKAADTAPTVAAT